ncbi:MAG: hypothetical protein LBR61_11775 [Synergistaceae bacterium]|nr:hypothetical protein [Synergistaceae bacterium]
MISIKNWIHDYLFSEKLPIQERLLNGVVFFGSFGLGLFTLVYILFFTDEASGDISALAFLTVCVCVFLFNFQRIVCQREKAGAERQKMLLSSLNRLSETLLTSHEGSVKDVIAESLTFIKKHIDIDSVFIWKNEGEDRDPRYRVVFQWRQNPAAPAAAQMESVVKAMQEWEFQLQSERCVRGLVNFSPKMQDILAPFGINTLLIVPVIIKEFLWGFVSFDQKHPVKHHPAQGRPALSESIYTPSEEDVLRSTAILTVNALIRAEAIEDLNAALEQMKMSSEVKSKFLADMSPEIRASLNAIIGMTSQVKNTDEKEMKLCLEKINISSRHLLNVVNDVLDMSKMHAGELELDTEDFNFREVMRVAVDLIAFQTDVSSDKLVVATDENIPKWLIGDGRRLLQVLSSLLSNAVKFASPEGTVTLDSRLVGEYDGLSKIQIRISSIGTDIGEEQQNRIFQVFSQSGSIFTRKLSGRGLRLALSKNIVEIMGGNISVESEPGSLSFIFTVRLRRGEPARLRVKTG